MWIIPATASSSRGFPNITKTGRQSSPILQTHASGSVRCWRECVFLLSLKGNERATCLLGACRILRQAQMAPAVDSCSILQVKHPSTCEVHRVPCLRLPALCGCRFVAVPFLIRCSHINMSHGQYCSSIGRHPLLRAEKGRRLGRHNRLPVINFSSIGNLAMVWIGGLAVLSHLSHLPSTRHRGSNSQAKKPQTTNQGEEVVKLTIAQILGL